jgi:hypothetical protein
MAKWLYDIANSPSSDDYKTLIIWSDFIDLPKLFMVNGDYRHLDGVVVNTYEDEDKEKELISLMYDDKMKIKLTAVEREFEGDRARPILMSSIVDAQFIIQCGFAL